MEAARRFVFLGKAAIYSAGTTVPSNWYLEAQEAKNLGLVEAVV